MTPYELIASREVGSIKLVDKVTFASGYDPDYYAAIMAGGSVLDYDYFKEAGVFSKTNPGQGKLAGDKGKILSDEDGGAGGHNDQPAQTS